MFFDPRLPADRHLCAQNGLDASNANAFRNVVTPGEVLREADCHTHASGKNHSYDNLRDRVFDHYYGSRDGACNHFNPGPDLPHRLQYRSGALDRRGRSHSGVGLRQLVVDE
jgi:arylsulfatase A-like enzyme